MMTTNAMVVQQPNFLTELKNTKEVCQMLMQTPHYAKMGQEGIFAIVETSKSLGIDPRQGLQGGLYFVKGKVEMSARLMAALIRSKKHSITKDGKSDETICILHGKRSDNGDCWSESFSIEEAKRAGLTKNPVWQNFTRDMLYARALSRLARQLFPDIIGNCYVEGEISYDPNIKPALFQLNASENKNTVEEPFLLRMENENLYPEEVSYEEFKAMEKKQKEKISNEQFKALSSVLDYVPDYKKKVLNFLSKQGINSLENMPRAMYEKAFAQAKIEAEKAEEEAQQAKDLEDEELGII